MLGTKVVMIAIEGCEAEGEVISNSMDRSCSDTMGGIKDQDSKGKKTQEEREREREFRDQREMFGC